MIRHIIKEDLPLIETIVGKDLTNRQDIDFYHSGLSIENGIIDSLTIIGHRSLSEFFGRKIPKEVQYLDNLGSQEIIAVYTKDNTFDTLWKTWGEFAFVSNHTLYWYLPKDEEDTTYMKKLLLMVSEPYGFLSKRMP